MKAAGAGFAQNARQNKMSSAKNLFTAAQVARPPRLIQGKWRAPLL
jgi:hypothetical protein